MLAKTFDILFARDLKRLLQQIEAYPDEAILWEVAPGISNSAGNLCLHLIGNLNTYIGKQLGGTNYVRDRDAEFSTKHVPRAELLAGLTTTSEVVSRTLSALPDDSFNEPYPEEVLGYPMTIHYFLTHLSGHLNYHLGQIDYHRRLLTKGQRVTYVQ
ncbi:hypothetical protein BN8_01108 [Fibrisoma limi BUZ 3]|uniref:DinB superfamily protein n=1 Tax=Fibrisoma limi BUZ 3 TaxID=1185876 RepID=I2GE09_9BACT|nr:DinB family protein [Fibrisoma limi]CCH52134.1 hypothetical protein BN8_01108 [Fibrisoma limi BUZ 3]